MGRGGDLERGDLEKGRLGEGDQFDKVRMG